MSLLSCRAQHWTHHSSYVFISAALRGKITSLDLLAMLFQTQPGEATGCLCCEGTLLARVQSARTPRSFCAKLLSIHVVSSMDQSMDLFLPKEWHNSISYFALSPFPNNF